MQVLRDGAQSIHKLKLGPLKTNCYIVAIGGGGFIVDPVADAPAIADYLDSIGVTLDFGMLTHAHFDHVGAAAGLIDMGRLDTLWYHPDDQAELARGNTYALLIAKKRIDLPPAAHCRHFDAGFEKMLAARGFAIRHLPGHTRGSCIIHSLDRKWLFTGDIILHNRVRGVRTAIGEVRTEMQAAVRAIAADFGPRTLIFPGHGALTILETELAYNAILKDLMSEA